MLDCKRQTLEVEDRLSERMLPRQAIILAGGRGSRLAPLTDTTPKPMIKFHGKPFLEYLIEMLREQGIHKVLLLLGYLPAVIQDYFGDGSQWGLSIEYSISAMENETGRRLKLALPRIDPVSLLLYCDNYWPMNLQAMWQHFSQRNADGQLTVYRNRDRYTKDNARIDDEGFIAGYDKNRTSPELAGVDIGFALLKRSVIEAFPDENLSFEQVAFQRLVAQRKLAAYATDHRYYSIGSLERLAATDAHLARHPTVFLDRDGVLNQRMPRACYVTSSAQWQWLPGARDALRLLRQAGYRVIVITNQPGIARGVMTASHLETIHALMKSEALLSGGEISAVYFCPHNWNEGCACRKPRPGLLFQAQRDFHLDLSRTYFIGDDQRDVQAAETAGCPWALVSEERPLLEVTRQLLAGTLPLRPTSLTMPQAA